MEKNVTLSVCILAKNEETNISRAIMSIKHIANEIIVLDTGSTDKTKDIAKELGALIHDFKWDNHFGNARNHLIGLAKMDWVLMIDCDESFNYKDTFRILDIIKKGDYDAFIFPRINMGLDQYLADYPDIQFRLFRNHMGFNIQGALDESLVFDLHSRGLKARMTDIHINHYYPTKFCQKYKDKMYVRDSLLKLTGGKKGYPNEQ
jgi:glycosyltransferase involved in cell wall biosynthesis